MAMSGNYLLGTSLLEIENSEFNLTLFRNRGEHTPLIKGRGRDRSEYEDLDEETFNNWPSKSYYYIL